MTDLKEKIKDADVSGLEYFDRLTPLLQWLPDDAGERDKAGNQ